MYGFYHLRQWLIFFFSLYTVFLQPTILMLMLAVRGNGFLLFDYIIFYLT